MLRSSPRDIYNANTDSAFSRIIRRPSSRLNPADRPFVAFHRIQNGWQIVRLELCWSSQEWQNVSRPTPPDPKGSNGNLTAVVAASGFFCLEPIMNTSTWSPYLLSILRIMSALLFVEHGTSKLLGFPPSQMHAPSGPPPPELMSLLMQASGPIE